MKETEIFEMCDGFRPPTSEEQQKQQTGKLGGGNDGEVVYFYSGSVTSQIPELLTE